MHLIFVLFCLVLLFWGVFKIYVRYKQPFWSLQPTMHVYDFQYNFYSPAVLGPCYRNPRMMGGVDYSPRKVTTLPMSPFLFTKKEKASAPFFEFYKELLGKQKKVRVAQTQFYFYSFFQDDQNYLSIYSDGLLFGIGGIMTSREVKVSLLGAERRIFFLDFFGAELATGKKERVLFQTHMFQQCVAERRKKKGVDPVTLFRRRMIAGEEYAVSPFFCYEEATIRLYQEALLPLSRKRRYFPDSVETKRIYRNLPALVEIFRTIEQSRQLFHFSATMEYDVMRRQVDESILFLYCVYRKKEIMAIYFVRDDNIQFPETDYGDTLHVVATFCLTDDIGLFQRGFDYSLREITRYKKTFRTCIFDLVGHTTKLHANWTNGVNGTCMGKECYGYHLHNSVFPQRLSNAKCTVLL